MRQETNNLGWLTNIILFISSPQVKWEGDILKGCRVGNLILTALAIGQEVSDFKRCSKKSTICTSHDILTLAWASGRVLISIPEGETIILLLLVYNGFK